MSYILDSLSKLHVVQQRAIRYLKIAKANINMQVSTSITEDQELYQRLVRGPAFLLLGQGYLSLQSQSDPFLSAVAQKYAETVSAPNDQNYDVILNSSASKDPTAALAWMQQRAERIAVPEWLRTVAGYGWNGVFSSAIEDVWVRAFKSEWREVQMLFDDKYKPLDPRNRLRLHCHFLFGAVNGPERTEQAPLHKFDWLKRKQVAVGLARRLPELISPMGVLVIEGYRGNDDWLKVEDLLPILDELGEAQTHIFSVSEELKRDSYIDLVCKSGKVVLHRESLATCLTRGDEAGFIALGERPDEQEHAGSIQLDKNVVLLPKEIRNQVLRSATILDDSTMLEPPALSEEALYREFRMFLSESSSVPIWSGFARGFAFVRPFERALHAEVESRLRGKSASDGPIILHGQTGTGKTVSLGQLAFNIRKQGTFPVLFIERKSKRPASSDIDTFCKFVEDRDASCTLVVWDGMIDVQQYDDLLQTLNGRGRKVVLVGSSYRIERHEQERGVFIEASAKLTADEVKSLKHFLARFDSSLNELVDREIQRWGDNFLVAMYRSLPYTRSAIRQGLEREVGFTVQRMEKRSKTVKVTPVAGTMAHALWKAGLIPKEPILEQVTDDIEKEEISQAKQVIRFVMVPGQFGLQTPLELLLRPLGHSAFQNFHELFDGVDLVRWEEDALGNITVRARNEWEAKRIVENNLGGPRDEMKCVSQLLIEIKDNNWVIDSPEIQFAVDLLRNVGPNSPAAENYKPYFLELAETLRRLREDRGVRHPRLSLQEATLLRDIVRRERQVQLYGLNEDQCDELLSRTESILTDSLNIVKAESKNDQMVSMILVELGATTASRALGSIKDKPDAKELFELYKQCRDYLFNARGLDPDNYYPIDALSWIARDVISSRLLDPAETFEIEADILHAFEVAEAEDYEIMPRVRLNRRRMEVANALGNRELSEDAFEKLAKLGSAAGHYIRAHHIAGHVPVDSELTSAERNRCWKAVSYLEEHQDAIANDARCLYLLLRLWWCCKNGKPMFYGVRQTTSLSRTDWEYAHDLISDLLQFGEEHQTPSLKYLLGLAEFHLDDVRRSFEIFKELSKESEFLQGRRRITRRYLASEPDGQPMKFDGFVQWQAEDTNKGEIFVNKLQCRVPFDKRDFFRDIKRGEVITDFHISFSFLGPIVDPAILMKTKSHRAEKD